MTVMRKRALLVAMALAGCGGPPEPRSTTPPPTVQATPGPRGGAPAVVPSGRAAERYRLSEGDYRAELRVWPAGEGRIRFELEVAAEGCDGTLDGDGRVHPQAHLGAESRELDGEMVFVDQYFYDTPDCSLSLLVDDPHEHAWVEVSECAAQTEACPYGDVGVFTRGSNHSGRAGS